MDQMTKKEWEMSDQLSRYTLKRIGFKSASDVRSALANNGCKILSEMRPINVEGELK